MCNSMFVFVNCCLGRRCCRFRQGIRRCRFKVHILFCVTFNFASRFRSFSSITFICRAYRVTYRFVFPTNRMVRFPTTRIMSRIFASRLSTMRRRNLLLFASRNNCLFTPFLRIFSTARMTRARRRSRGFRRSNNIFLYVARFRYYYVTTLYRTNCAFNIDIKPISFRYLYSTHYFRKFCFSALYTT